jgi:hypothetical protein
LRMTEIRPQTRYAKHDPARLPIAVTRRPIIIASTKPFVA